MDLTDIFSGPLTKSKWRALGAFLESADVIGGVGVAVSTIGRKTIVRAKRRQSPNRRGGGAPTPPLSLVTSRPPYIPPGAPPPGGHGSVWVTWGFANGRLPGNWASRLDLPLGTDVQKYIALRVNFAAASVPLVVSSCEWETWSSETEKTSPEWSESGARPAYLYIPLGSVIVADGTMHALPAGGGSINVIEYLADLTQNGAAGFSYRRGLTYTRLTY